MGSYRNALVRRVVYEGQLAKLGRDETTIWWNLKENENIVACHGRLIKDTALEPEYRRELS
jgi:hypothetical protein